MYLCDVNPQSCLKMYCILEVKNPSTISAHMDADTNHTVLDREKAVSREGSNYHF